MLGRGPAPDGDIYSTIQMPFTAFHRGSQNRFCVQAKSLRVPADQPQVPLANSIPSFAGSNEFVLLSWDGERETTS